MLDDLSEAYTAQRRGQPPQLPPVRLQYPDFAGWQARREGGALQARQVCCCLIRLLVSVHMSATSLPALHWWQLALLSLCRPCRV